MGTVAYDYGLRVSMPHPMELLKQSKAHFKLGVGSKIFWGQ
jgi:hypothetical protein